MKAVAGLLMSFELSFDDDDMRHAFEKATGLDYNLYVMLAKGAEAADVAFDDYVDMVNSWGEGTA